VTATAVVYLLRLTKVWESTMKILKFLFVDSTVNILGDLFEQPLVMWGFIGLGWLCVLVMIASVIQTLPSL
jgi:hypothetical protein